MAEKPEKAHKPEEPAQAPKSSRPRVRHPLLAGAAIGLAAFLGAKGAKPQEAPPAPIAAPARVASAETREARGAAQAPIRPTTVVAQTTTTTPTTASDTTAGGEGRLHNAGGMYIDENVTFPMTTQQYAEQVAYMFDLTSQYEVLPTQESTPGWGPTYTTDEFVIKSVLNWGTPGCRYGSVCVYAKNDLDGVHSNHPLEEYWMTGTVHDDTVKVRVFRFRVTPTAVVGSEVIAVVRTDGNGGDVVDFFTFDPALGKYICGGAALPEHVGKNSRIGIEMNERDGMIYIVAARDEDFTEGNIARVGSVQYQVALGLNPDPSRQNGLIPPPYASAVKIVE